MYHRLNSGIALAIFGVVLSLATALPSPAIVVTVPSGDTRRIAWLPVSATTSVPSGASAIPEGVAKRASLPRPSANPRPPPASVDTLPSTAIRRMRCDDPASLTKIRPSVEAATPNGSENRASSLAPSCQPSAQAWQATAPHGVRR